MADGHTHIPQSFLRDYLTWKPVARLFGLAEENRNVAHNPPLTVTFRG